MPGVEGGQPGEALVVMASPADPGMDLIFNQFLIKNRLLWGQPSSFHDCYRNYIHQFAFQVQCCFLYIRYKKQSGRKGIMGAQMREKTHTERHTDLETC